MKNTIKTIIIIIILFLGQSCLYSQKFPPESCDSLLEYQYLRKQYEQYIGKTFGDVYATDSLAISGRYNSPSKNSFSISFNGLNHTYGHVNFYFKSNETGKGRDFYQDIVCAEIYRIVILIYAYDELFEDNGVKCLMYIQ